MSLYGFDMATLVNAGRSLRINLKRFDMLACALTHPSVTPNPTTGLGSHPSTYQRLEFLGDRVLGLAIAERLLYTFPQESEGELARRYAVLVSTATLADVARRIQLASHVKFSRGEEAQNGADNSANLADTCEAVIGAVYLDGGIEEARDFIEREWVELIRAQEKPPRDPKTGLQEWTQARGLGLPRYEIISQGGPAHSPTFTIEVHIQGFSPAIGCGKSKRYAERLAAEQMLARLFEEGLIDKRG